MGPRAPGSACPFSDVSAARFAAGLAKAPHPLARCEPLAPFENGFEVRYFLSSAEISSKILMFYLPVSGRRTFFRKPKTLGFHSPHNTQHRRIRIKEI
jgi:hypothetical protein